MNIKIIIFVLVFISLIFNTSCNDIGTIKKDQEQRLLKYNNSISNIYLIIMNNVKIIKNIQLQNTEYTNIQDELYLIKKDWKSFIEKTNSLREWDTNNIKELKNFNLTAIRFYFFAFHISNYYIEQNNKNPNWIELYHALIAIAESIPEYTTLVDTKDRLLLNYIIQ